MPAKSFLYLVYHIVGIKLKQRRELRMKGIYCLIINVKKDITLKIGSLGIINFQKSLYAYIGSAQNNLKKRIERHLSKTKNIRWHIDYLLSNPAVRIEKVLYKETGKQEECRTASLLSETAEGIKGFGCSDCKCYSHLFRSGSEDDLDWEIYKEII